MATDKTVKTDDAGNVQLTGDQILDLVRAMMAANQLDAEKIAEISAMAAATAHQKVNQWWDDRVFPDISVFNPEGELKHPRPTLTREIFWAGYRLREEELTRAEIEMFNLLTPGRFHRHDALGGIVERDFFTVKERDPGLLNGPLDVAFPCRTNDERMKLAGYDRGRGKVDILLEMLPGQREPVAVPA